MCVRSRRTRVCKKTLGINDPKGQIRRYFSFFPHSVTEILVGGATRNDKSVNFNFTNSFGKYRKPTPSVIQIPDYPCGRSNQVETAVRKYFWHISYWVGNFPRFLSRVRYCVLTWWNVILHFYPRIALRIWFEILYFFTSKSRVGWEPLVLASLRWALGLSIIWILLLLLLPP